MENVDWIIRQEIKNHLRLRVEKHGGSFGSAEFLEIKLVWHDEEAFGETETVIDSVHIDLPRED